MSTALTVIYVIIATTGLVLAVACLIFTYIFRKKKCVYSYIYIFTLKFVAIDVWDSPVLCLYPVVKAVPSVNFFHNADGCKDKVSKSVKHLCSKLDYSMQP